MKRLIFLYIYLLSYLGITAGCEIQTEPSSLPIKFDNTVSLVNYKVDFMLVLPENHPQELAIVDPDGTWFYLQGENIENPLMPNSEFTQMDSISISTVNLKAIKWVDGKTMMSPVFSKEGIYSIYLSDNLETEPENALTFIKKVKLLY